MCAITFVPTAHLSRAKSVVGIETVIDNVLEGETHISANFNISKDVSVALESSWSLLEKVELRSGFGFIGSFDNSRFGNIGGSLQLVTDTALEWPSLFSAEIVTQKGLSNSVLKQGERSDTAAPIAIQHGVRNAVVDVLMFQVGVGNFAENSCGLQFGLFNSLLDRQDFPSLDNLGFGDNHWMFLFPNASFANCGEFLFPNPS